MVCHPVAADIDVKERILPCGISASQWFFVHIERGTWEWDGGLWESAHSCRSAAGFIISKPKRWSLFCVRFRNNRHFLLQYHQQTCAWIRKHWKAPQLLACCALWEGFVRDGMVVLRSKPQLAASYLVVPMKTNLLQLTKLEEISKFFCF